jgi:hypothetical protein
MMSLQSLSKLKLKTLTNCGVLNTSKLNMLTANLWHQLQTDVLLDHKDLLDPEDLLVQSVSQDHQDLLDLSAHKDLQESKDL